MGGIKHNKQQKLKIIKIKLSSIILYFILPQSLKDIIELKNTKFYKPT